MGPGVICFGRLVLVTLGTRAGLGIQDGDSSRATQVEPSPAMHLIPNAFSIREDCVVTNEVVYGLSTEQNCGQLLRYIMAALIGQ